MEVHEICSDYREDSIRSCDILSNKGQSRDPREKTPLADWLFTFCLRQATHAVIFRLMSGSFLSPNDSLRDIAAGVAIAAVGCDCCTSGGLARITRKICRLNGPK